MREFKTENRLKKIINTVRARQHTLQVVLENIHDPHNVSAIFRTCDAVGVPEVSLLYHIEQFPKINRISSASANKWVQRERYTTVDDCYGALREKGFKIYASTLSPESVDLYSLDLTEKVALVLGNEHRGISEEAAQKADKVFLIPMMGMVQSLNVSVAAAVILYEALRQRKDRNMYDVLQKDESEIERIIDEWCDK
ncbi:MAG: TrmH family RNA methyltransferase [Bacteroidota bacterium]